MGPPPAFQDRPCPPDKIQPSCSGPVHYAGALICASLAPLRSPRYGQILGTPGAVPGVLTFLVFLGVQKKIAPVIPLNATAQQRYFVSVTICLHRTAGLLLIAPRVQFENIRFTL